MHAFELIFAFYGQKLRLKPVIDRFLTKYLKKLPNFGESLQGNEKGYFEWPKLDDILEIGLSQPLKLQAIYVKWHRSDQLTAIQLVFEGGRKSPLFDGK